MDACESFVSIELESWFYNFNLYVGNKKDIRFLSDGGIFSQAETFDEIPTGHPVADDQRSKLAFHLGKVIVEREIPCREFLEVLV